MRFFGSWWERIPVRAVVPSAAAVVVAFGAFAHVASIIHELARVTGSLWD